MRRAFIVTALALEMEAVRAHLKPLGAVAGRGGAVYECGVFSDSGKDWLVVVAETGQGTHPAQGTVTYANVMFPGFEVQILAGIGGSRKSEASIGSVVAADHVYMPYSAKYSGGRRLGRPREFQVDQRLVGIARKVCRDKTWPLRIRDHKDGKFRVIETDGAETVPRARVAPVASVEAVLDDPESELEALIADGYGDTCVVEMEGYGAVYAASQEQVPSIVVRGVSDMTRDKTPEADGEFQPVAASHAAAFAFEMLSHWAQVHPADTRGTPDDLLGPSADDIGPGGGAAGPADDSAGGATEAILEPDPARVGEAEAPAAAKPSPDIVLNVDEESPADLDARVSALEALLRELVHSDRVTVTGAKSGSLHLLVADPLGELRKIGVEALRTGFAERDGPEVLGMVDVTEYERLDAVRARLAAASAELLDWPNALPDGEIIDRPELVQLAERLDGSVASTTAVLGPPGAGKSALLATLSNRYAGNGWPVLAIKGDLLDAGVSSEKGLQEHLALDAPPSDLLQRLARFQPVLLVLDQLDALAGHLDLRTARLSVLLGLVRRLGGIGNVHIVLSSRTFEFEHDVRLRAASTEALSLELPAWSQVLALLEERGVHAAGWPEDAKETMRSPQALATYLKLRGRHGREAFTSYQDMLDELWQERVLSGTGGDRRGRLASEIADQMATEESLWLARARFDDSADDIRALEAAGVLATSTGSLGFRHQTLFEYALARSFARRKGRLAWYVLERQTSLFFRSKLWAGLSYLRNADLVAYHDELEAIWTAPDLRTHLRFLLIDFLGKEMNPTDQEALLMEQALRSPERRWRAYRALAGSPGWFERFSRSHIAACMDESDEAADAMVNVLARAWPFAEDAVLGLVKERWMPGTSQDSRSWMVIHGAPSWSDAALEVACEIARRSEIAQHYIDHCVETIGAEQPEAALHLVRARLDRELAAAKGSAEELSGEERPGPGNVEVQVAWELGKHPRIPLDRVIDQRLGWEALPSLAERAPAEFLEILWPWFERCFSALRARTEERPGRLGFAPGPDFRFEEEGDSLSEPILLSGLRVAAERLARTDPDAWWTWASEVAGLDMEPVQRLIAHCLACFPERFASEALAFLLKDSRRYALGSISDLTSTSARLVAAASESWTEEEIARFEAAMRNFGPPAPPVLTDPKDRRGWRNRVRRIRLSLLRALPKHRLTARMRRHVEQEERVFPDPGLGVRMSGAQFIGSIMDSSMIARALDEDVVNAFRTLPDASGWNHPRDWKLGGNVQLSREFANFAKENPGRAIRLIGSLDPENGTRAAAYALQALSENADSERVLQLFRDVVCRGFDSEEFRGSASWGMVKLVDRGVAMDDDVVSILEGWLADPWAEEGNSDNVEPEPDIDTGAEASGAERENEEDGIHRSLLWGHGGVSRVPGGVYPVLEALIRIRLAREDFDAIDEMLHARLDRSKDPELWDNLLRYAALLHPKDGLRRTALLERLFDEVPGLVETREAAHVVGRAHWWNPEFVDSQLDRWADSQSRAARQAYGEIVAAAALLQPALGWAQGRLDALVNDGEMRDARMGAALTAANLWPDSRHRAGAGALLTRLLATGEAGVWKAAFELFRLTDELTPDAPTVSLLTAIADRMAAAPRLEAGFVAESLGTLLPHEAGLVGRLAEGLMENWRKEIGDIRTRTATAAAQLVDLAVTLHRLGPETRETGTALFESLIEADAWEARQAMDEIDNRFLDAAPPRRRRLARRRRGPGRRPGRPAEATTG